MTLSEKISHLCEENGVTRNKFEIESGVGRGQSARWDTNKPSADKLKLAADYFGVSVEYLLAPDIYIIPGPLYKKITAPVTEDGLQDLKDDERVLLEHYRSMTEGDRDMMRDLARRLTHAD